MEDENIIPEIHPSIQLFNSAYNDNMNKTPMERTTDSGSGDMYGYNIGLGSSKYDENLSPTSHINFDNFNNSLEDYRSKNQYGITKTLAGLGRIGSEFLINTLDAGAMSVAAIANIGSDNWLDDTVNNAFSQGLENMKQHINEEYLPVYVKNSVKNGNFMDNISSIDFWATEGASGIAFMAGAMVPGGAMKALGTGAKLTKLLGGTGKMLSKSKSTLSTLRKVDQMVAKASGGALGANPSQITNFMDLAAATTVNTLFEAGVEARGAGETYENDLNRRASLDPSDKEYITPQQYEELLAKKPEQMAKVFKTNAALLLLPNAIMNKALLGRLKPKQQLYKFGRADGKITSELASKSTRELIQDKAKDIGKNIGKATASEGFLEEAGQMTAEKYNVEGFLNRELGIEDKSMFDTYMDVVGSTEGQKAIFLGGLLGSGAMSFQDYRQNKVNTKRETELADLMTKHSNIFELMQKGLFNDAGEINQELVAELGNNLDLHQMKELQSMLLSQEANKGNLKAKDQLEALEFSNINNMLTSFAAAGKDGVNLLKDYLENSVGMDSYIAKLNESGQSNKTKDQYIQELVDDTTKLSEDIEFFQGYANLYYQDLLDIPGRTDELFNAFQNQKLSEYGRTNAMVRFQNNKLNNLNNQLEEAWNRYKERNSNAQTTDITDSQSYAEFQKRLKEGETKDSKVSKLDKRFRESKLITSLRERIEQAESMKDHFNQKLNELEDNDVIVKEFKEKIKAKEKQEKLKEEKVDEAIDEAINKINTANSQEEIDNIISEVKDIPETGINSINEAASKRKEVINKEKAEKAKAAAAAKSQQKNDKSDLNEEIDLIKKNLDINDSISKYPAVIAKVKEFVSEATMFFYGGNTDEGIEVMIDDGSFIPINKETITSNSSVNNTEGSIEEDSTSENTSQSNKESKKDITKDTSEDNNNNSSEVKVMSTAKYTEQQIADNPELEDKNGEILEGVPSEYLDYERNGKSKKGDKVTFKINQNIPKDNYKYKTFTRALKLYKSLKQGNTLSKKDRDFVIDNLPLVVEVEKGIYSFIESAPNSQNKKANKAFNNRARKLRENILISLENNGFNEKALYTTISGQYGGKINIEGGREVKNNVLDINGLDKNNLEFFVINDNGSLENVAGEEINYLVGEKAAKFKGAVYVKIPKANGEPFYLQLNFDRVSEAQAELIYDLYEQRINHTVKHTDTLDKLPKEILDNIKENFQTELDLFKKYKKGIKDITISEFTDILAWDGSDNPKSAMKVNVKDGTITFGSTTINKEELAQSKEEFKTWISNNKNRNIKFKGKKTDSTPINMSDPRYRDYVLNNTILNTNIDVNEPFAGFSNIYINSEVSDVNSKGITTQTKKITSHQDKILNKIQGESKEFKSEEKEINGKKQSVYTKDGKTYERQSNYVTRKTEGFDEIAPNDATQMGAAIGNIVDIIGRDVFSNVAIRTLEDYHKEADSLDSTNKFMSRLSQEQFDSLVKKMESIRNGLEIGGFKFISQDFTIAVEYNTKEKKATGFDGIAGTLDLVAIDPDGGIHIIDFKSTTINEGNADKSVDDLIKKDAHLNGSKWQKWSKQQTVYARIAQEYGLNVNSINILSFASQYERVGNELQIDDIDFMLNRGKLTNNNNQLADKLIKLPFDNSEMGYGDINKDFDNDVSKQAKPKKSNGVPQYTIDRTLKNSDGSKRLASTDGKLIKINPVETVKEFYKYFEGKSNGDSSKQKRMVLANIEKQGYNINVIKSVLNSAKVINTFLIYHEQDHIDNNDKDVYWDNTKNLLTDDKIEIESRSTINALKNTAALYMIPLKIDKSTPKTTTPTETNPVIKKQEVKDDIDKKCPDSKKSSPKVVNSNKNSVSLQSTKKRRGGRVDYNNRGGKKK